MTSLATQGGTARRRIRVVGVVQGVGFRPFVHRLATELGLSGHVGNDTEGVFVEVEGAEVSLHQFEARLVADAPPLARIFGVEGVPIALRHEHEFRIVASQSDDTARTFVSPDVAVCDECLAEMFDPGDRRARYPFINCTNCGPRFTITIRLPYDRPNTTMRGFELCAACSGEYHDLSDRRYHAQPVACARCGPRIWFEGSGGSVQGTDAALAATQESLARGEVVAIKGLGGYHLACDGSSDAAVGRLRASSGRTSRWRSWRATFRRRTFWPTSTRLRQRFSSVPSGRSCCCAAVTTPSWPNRLHRKTRRSGCSFLIRRCIIFCSTRCPAGMPRSPP